MHILTCKTYTLLLDCKKSPAVVNFKSIILIYYILCHLSIRDPDNYGFESQATMQHSGSNTIFYSFKCPIAFMPSWRIFTISPDFPFPTSYPMIRPVCCLSLCSFPKIILESPKCLRIMLALSFDCCHTKSNCPFSNLIELLLYLSQLDLAWI